MRDSRRNNKGRYNPRFKKDNYSEQNRSLALPSPALLESYDEISPGLADKLVDLIKSEQRHRHEWENKYLNSMNNTARLGQLFGIAIAIIIIYATILVANEKENFYLALTICVSGFAFLSCATLASVRTKQNMRKPYSNKSQRH